ncbi:MAG TPA: hypothetical protein VEF90_14595, partial [Xanthobacteraceae bacterium]|nr:hypothetical protein [Xanthobacteraceae bacterium]
MSTGNKSSIFGLVKMRICLCNGAGKAAVGSVGNQGAITLIERSKRLVGGNDARNLEDVPFA